MAEELGKIEKPPVEKFEKSRKVFFVPLIFLPLEPEGDFSEKVRRYWDEIEEHVTNLELKLGSVSRVYHELISVGGDEGSKFIEQLNSAGYQVVRARLDRGAEIEPLEDADLLTEFMDWSRCLAVGLQNQSVLTKVYESYVEVQSKRKEDMAKRIDETLKEGDVGILLMREGHQVQFPADIEVFYVSPPGLDEIKRWLRTREEELQNRMREDLQNQMKEDSEE